MSRERSRPFALSDQVCSYRLLFSGQIPPTLVKPFQRSNGVVESPAGLVPGGKCGFAEKEKKPEDCTKSEIPLDVFQPAADRGLIFEYSKLTRFRKGSPCPSTMFHSPHFSIVPSLRI